MIFWINSVDSLAYCWRRDRLAGMGEPLLEATEKVLKTALQVG